MAEGKDLDGNRPALAQSLAELALVDDHDVVPRGLVHQLFPGVAAAPALDQIEARAHLVRAVDADVDVPGTLVVEQGDALARRLGAALLAGREIGRAAGGDGGEP